MKVTHTDVWLLPLNVKKVKVKRRITFGTSVWVDEEIDLSPNGFPRQLSDSVRLLPRERQEVRK